MAKIIVYNNDINKMEVFHRSEGEVMPYCTDTGLTVGVFRGSSESPTLWTTKGAMRSWSRQREIWGAPIPVGYAFKRPWEGGHGVQSQHYAGTAFDTAQNMLGWTNEERAALRQSVINSGLWMYVEPVSLSPTWVHMDRRQKPPACRTGGYPALRRGSLSVYVLILQDSLNTLGFPAGTLDGVFGQNTASAVCAFQRGYGLHEDCLVGCETWRAMMPEAVGHGRTANTVD